MSPTVHGTCVAWRNSGVLIIGPSGSGKSQLALAMMGEGKNAATLVADDRVLLRVESDRIVASAPPAIKGKIERFGMGIETHPTCPMVSLGLVVELVPRDKIERMPEPDALEWHHEGIKLPKLILPAQPINAIAAIDATLRGFGA